MTTFRACLLAGLLLVIGDLDVLAAQEVLWTPEDAQELHNAQEDLNRGAAEAALSSLDQLQQRYPGSAIVQRLRGHALEALERPVLAREAFAKALAGGAFSAEVLSALLRLDYANDRIPAALSSSRLLLLLEPDKPQWALAYGDLLQQGGWFAQAELIFENLVAAGDRSPTLFERLGRAALSNGDRSEALVRLETSYYLGSTDANLPRLIAQLWFESGDPQRAQDWQARSDASEEELSGLLRVQRAFQWGDFGTADQLAQALERQGTPELRAQAAAWRGRIAVARGEPDAASPHFRRAIDAGSLDGDILAYLGSEAFNANRMPEALALLSRAWEKEARPALLPFLIRAAIASRDAQASDRFLIEYIERNGLNEEARSLIAQRAGLPDE